MCADFTHILHVYIIGMNDLVGVLFMDILLGLLRLKTRRIIEFWGLQLDTSMLRTRKLIFWYDTIWLAGAWATSAVIIR